MRQSALRATPMGSTVLPSMDFLLRYHETARDKQCKSRHMIPAIETAYQVLQTDGGVASIGCFCGPGPLLGMGLFQQELADMC